MLQLTFEHHFKRQATRETLRQRDTKNTKQFCPSGSKGSFDTLFNGDATGDNFKHISGVKKLSYQFSLRKKEKRCILINTWERGHEEMTFCIKIKWWNAGQVEKLSCWRNVELKQRYCWKIDLNNTNCECIMYCIGIIRKCTHTVH